MFYLFSQNNSGGYFIVNDKVCNKLIIEADCKEEATKVAENLGCYWDGVSKGIDCPCCGDRWTDCEKIDIDELKSYPVWVYEIDDCNEVDADSIEKWYHKYGKYTIIKQPELKIASKSSVKKYVGIIAFNNIEEYAQYIADEYGWTDPDIRIYYKGGIVTEIFRDKNI